MPESARFVGGRERDLGAFAHLTALAGILLPPAFLLGPVAFWLVHRKADPFVRLHARAAVEFQLTVALAALAVVGLLWVDHRVAALGSLLALALVDILLVCLGAARAARGEANHYPCAIPFLGRGRTATKGREPTAKN